MTTIQTIPDGQNQVAPFLIDKAVLLRYKSQYGGIFGKLYFTVSVSHVTIVFMIKCA